MNVMETTQLLNLLAQFDNRDYDQTTVAAWQMSLRDVPFEVAQEAVFAHQRDPEQRHTYFKIAHILDHVDERKRQDAREMEGMVKTARGLGIVTGWPTELDDEQVAQVRAWRDKNAAFGNTEAITSGTGKAIDLGPVGKDVK